MVGLLLGIQVVFTDFTLPTFWFLGGRVFIIIVLFCFVLFLFVREIFAMVLVVSLC